VDPEELKEKRLSAFRRRIVKEEVFTTCHPTYGNDGVAVPTPEWWCELRSVPPYVYLDRDEAREEVDGAIDALQEKYKDLAAICFAERYEQLEAEVDEPEDAYENEWSDESLEQNHEVQQFWVVSEWFANRGEEVGLRITYLDHVDIYVWSKFTWGNLYECEEIGRVVQAIYPSVYPDD
jgi:hypothetical protein